MLPDSRFPLYPPPDLPRTTERNCFRTKLDLVLDSLYDLERKIDRMSLGIPREFHWIEYDIQKKELLADARLDELFPSEQRLFTSLFHLFEIEHGFGLENQAVSDRLAGPFSGQSIVFLGPLASGKSTLANELAGLYKVKPVPEPLLDNGFLVGSEDLDKNHPHKPILQSQMFYLLSSILSNINLRLRNGVSISDTSIFNDALLWAPFYFETGYMTNEEYQTYQKMVALFKPIFAKPDLLVCVVAEDPEQLFRGKTARGRPFEQGEVFSLENLARQNEIADGLADSIGSEFGIPVLKIAVSPQKLYRDWSYRFSCAEIIRKKLGSS